MSDDSIILTLKEKVAAIIADNKNLRSELKKASSERDRLGTQKRNAEQKIQTLEQRIRVLETAIAFTGDKKENRAAKLRVNRLLREIDQCIALVNK